MPDAIGLDPSLRSLRPLSTGRLHSNNNTKYRASLDCWGIGGYPPCFFFLFSVDEGSIFAPEFGKMLLASGMLGYGTLGSCILSSQTTLRGKALRRAYLDFFSTSDCLETNSSVAKELEN